MFKILVIYQVLSSLLLAQIYECQAFDSTTDDNISNSFYNQNIKIYFELENKQLTINMLTSIEKLRYQESFPNIDDVHVDYYVNKDLSASIYSYFKNGVRIIMNDDTVYDFVDCKNIQREIINVWKRTK
jgi:hypothetical protein